jgi:hypothetical protein
MRISKIPIDSTYLKIYRIGESIRRKKMPKNKVIETWSGAKYRYRKDGKLDQRYTYGKKIEKANHLIGRNIRVTKQYARRPVIGNKRAFWIFVVYLVLLGTLLLLKWITELRGEIINPYIGEIMAIAEAKELKKEEATYCEQDYVTGEICKYTDWDAKIMIAIAKSENGYEMYGGWNTDAYNINDNGTIDVGIFMINSIHGRSLEDMIDPIKNIEEAHRVWLSQGYYAWSDYNNRRFERYLNG